jgi:hypothetical protein
MGWEAEPPKVRSQAEPGERGDGWGTGWVFSSSRPQNLGLRVRVLGREGA